MERRDGGAQRGAPARAGDDGKVCARHDAPAPDVDSRRRCAGRGSRAAVRTCCATTCRSMSGAGLQPGVDMAYHHIARGELDAAVKERTQDPQEVARVLRLAAASDGASREIIERALALPIDQGIDSDSVWAALGLALRERRDPAPYLAAIREDKDDDSEKVLAFITALRSCDQSRRCGAAARRSAARSAWPGLQRGARDPGSARAGRMAQRRGPVAVRAGAAVLQLALRVLGEDCQAQHAATGFPWRLGDLGKLLLFSDLLSSPRVSTGAKLTMRGVSNEASRFRAVVAMGGCSPRHSQLQSGLCGCASRAPSRTLRQSPAMAARSRCAARTSRISPRSCTASCCWPVTAATTTRGASSIRRSTSTRR